MDRFVQHWLDHEEEIPLSRSIVLQAEASLRSKHLHFPPPHDCLPHVRFARESWAGVMFRAYQQRPVLQYSHSTPEKSLQTPLLARYAPASSLSAWSCTLVGAGWREIA